MKLTLIGPVTPYRGGIAHFTTLMANKLIEAGHQVQVISFKQQYPAWLYPGASDKDTSPGRERVDAEFLLSPLNPWTWQRTVRAIIDFRPEKVILPWWVTFWGPAFRFIICRLKRQGIPTTVLIHNTIPHEPKPWDRMLARRTLQEADRFLVMTEKEKGRLLDLLPGAKRISVTPLPIYSPFKLTGQPKADLRARLGLPAEVPVLLFFGFVRLYKGLVVLIKALHLLAGQGSNAHLLVAGEFWEDKENYLALIREFGLEARVHIHDSYIPDSEAGAFFEASDLFVAPYIDGTQSAALKTALWFGLPVVVTEAAADELVASIPQNCIVVPMGSATALAEGIQKLLTSPSSDQQKTNTLIDQSWQSMATSLVDDVFEIRE